MSIFEKWFGGNMGSEKELVPDKIEEENVERSKDVQIIIKLPEDPARVEKLKLKLDEYRERLDKKRDSDTIYKIAILSNVLAHGEANTEEIAKELSSLYGGINRSDFDNAVIVIYDYVIAGGTGLTKPGMGLE